MGIKVRAFLDGHRDIVACRKCRTHLTTESDLVSRDFQGTTGRAHLYSKMVNWEDAGPESTRSLTTGVHVVRDIKCGQCGTVLGWRYIRAFEEEQRYKEGKWILERALTVNTEDKPLALQPSDLDDGNWVIVRNCDDQ